MRMSTVLAAGAIVGLTTVTGVFGNPAAAAERATPRYNLTMAWPAVDEATPMTAIALAESGGETTEAGNIEFEWKVEEGER